MKEKIAQIEQLLVTELAGCEQLQALHNHGNELLHSDLISFR